MILLVKVRPTKLVFDYRHNIANFGNADFRPKLKLFFVVAIFIVLLPTLVSSKLYVDVLESCQKHNFDII